MTTIAAESDESVQNPPCFLALQPLLRAVFDYARQQGWEAVDEIEAIEKLLVSVRPAVAQRTDHQPTRSLDQIDLINTNEGRAFLHGRG